MSSNFLPLRGYSELILEEVALEGLDGITLRTLYKRLSVNPEWIMKPTDSFVEEFIWKCLVALREVRWYKIREPREDPPIFASFDEYLEAIESKEVDPELGSKYYKYCEVKNGEDMGSCTEYKTRVEVTQEIQNCTLSTAKTRWSDHLVIVANQEVRSYVLLSGDLHYELDALDVTTYCILERIGRSRRSGELSISLNFIKNGANPTFYFWNKLRRRDLITSQNVCLKTKYSSLFFLKRYHGDIAKLTTSILIAVIKSIESSPNKACTLLELKQIHPKISKLLRYGAYREHLQVEKVPYSQYYTNSKSEEWLAKNGKERIVTTIKLIDKSEPRKSLQNYSNVDENGMAECEEETEDYLGILEETRIANKPLISQCFHVINEAGVDGISQVELGRKVGLNKLLTRTLLKTLIKNDLVVSSGAENAKTRFYKYYSKNFSYVKDLKLKQLSEISEMFSNDDASDVSMIAENKQNCVEKESCSPTGNARKDTKTRETTKKSENDDKILEVKSENLYTMRRANIILEHVYKNHAELKANLKQIIQKEENRQGFFQGDLDRRSLNKILDMLVNCRKIKIITKTVTEPTFNKSKEMIFVCTPNVTEEHPAIKASIQQAQDSLSILYVKHAGAGSSRKKSLTDLKPLLYIGTKNASKHGHAPKFVRMRVLHELLFYMLFSYKGDENLDLEDYSSFIRSVCDEFEVDEKLPKCYVKEISWKMFIPPLMKYEEYKDGWVAQNDIIERIPLRLLFMLIRLPHEIPNLQEYLSHPIKQHYLIQDLPADMQKIIRVDKQYLYLLNLTFRFLAMIGLLQFGPRLAYRGNANLIYVNRKATILDTRSCPPGYSKIDTNVSYPVHCYDLNSLSDIETYWSDAMRFALGTKLGKSHHKGTDMSVPDPERIPERLREPLKCCAIDEAPSRDTGKTPGDGQGALGFDSSLYAHLVRSWFFSRKRSSDSGADKSEPVTPKKSKLMEQISSRTQVTKMKRYRYTVPKKTKARSKTGKLSYDEADEIALRNMKTLRVQWTKGEDDILMMIYLAVLYSAQYLSGYRPRRLIRKLMHESCKKSLDKTALACSRRTYRLMKDKVKEHSVNVYLNELMQDTNLITNYQTILDEVEKKLKEKNMCTSDLTILLDKLTEQVFQYLRNNVKAAEISSSGMYETSLPDDIETFMKLCRYEYPGVSNPEKSYSLQTESDISVLVIINLIFSSLFSQVDKKKKINTNFMHHLFRNFDDSRLKKALAYVRLHRLISFNKSTERSRSSYLPIGQGVYHLSMTFHLLLKSQHPVDVYNQMYARYLEMIGYQDCGYVDISTYEAGLNLFLIPYFLLNEVQFDISIPKAVLFFDPKPLPIISPEEVAKPMFEATSSFTDETLWLIKKTFFETNGAQNSPDKLMRTSGQDSDSDDDLEYERDAEVEEDSTNSNLTLFLTRRQFRQAEVRFSNAYDHFLINLFPMKYKINSVSSRRKLSLPSDSENLIRNFEKGLTYRKLKYTVEEMSRKIQKHLSVSHERDCASSVLDFLRQCGVSGATTYTLRSKFNDFQLLKKVTDALCKTKLVLRSGSKFTHYIHVEYAASWLLPCQKNVELYIEDNGKDDEPIVINRNKTEKHSEMQNDGQIWVHLKPWVHANGALNREALDSLLIRVLSYFTKCPSSSLELIQNKFSPAIQPHYTRELVEILVDMKCVKVSSLPPPPEISLFSSHTSDFSISDIVSGFEDEGMILIESDVNAMLKLAVFLGNVNRKDLLETKYFTDVSSTVKDPSEVEGTNVSQDGGKDYDD